MTQSTDCRTLVLVGTYTKDYPCEGIYVYEMEPESGRLELLATAGGIPSPTYLAVSPDLHYLYAPSNVGRDAVVAAYAFDAATGALSLLNTQPAQGTVPCYVTLDATGKWVLTANYGDGSAAVYPVEADGRLGEAACVVRHQGSSANPRRQEGPHAHSITVDAANRFVFVADLGIDRVMIYGFNATTGALTPAAVPYVEVHAGAGPRHFVFHPSQRFAYLINELDSTLIAFAYDAETGRLDPLQTVPGLPEGYEGTSWAADLHLGSGGRFLYGSNRGHDSIVVYSIDPAEGSLCFVGHVPSGGRIPRGFALSPDGRFLICANQDTDNLVTFTLDAHTGLPRATGLEVAVSAPVCVKFVQVPVV
jgi:6-phosphogluconolactonase